MTPEINATLRDEYWRDLNESYQRHIEGMIANSETRLKALGYSQPVARKCAEALVHMVLDRQARLNFAGPVHLRDG